ncbi:hypothetical protein L210DRAFT_3646933 [Boletus edulis BED1]|uniref:Uncharacterized protein n=1 Tax=Boletus edulis BED1 TaxID=1328754 RepID=A0AAD4BR80_BOLED|nr:hypothetical protein L210DRAFT_3646933 [Boletus edulis BED1]
MPIAKHTLPSILARSRDTDADMRRLVYSAILEKSCTTPDGFAMGPLHPCVLAILQGSSSFGLDLETVNLQCALPQGYSSVPGSMSSGGLQRPRKAVVDVVLAFLGLFDLHENTVAEDAHNLAYQIQGVYNKYQEDVDTVSQERALRELDANERPGRDLDERLSCSMRNS